MSTLICPIRLWGAVAALCAATTGCDVVETVPPVADETALVEASGPVVAAERATVAVEDADPVAWLLDRQIALRAAFDAGHDARPLVAEMIDARSTAEASFNEVWAGLDEMGRAEIEADTARVLQNRYCELARSMSATYDEVMEVPPEAGEPATVVAVRYMDEAVGATVIRHGLVREGDGWRVHDVRGRGFSIRDSFAAQAAERIRRDGADAARAALSRIARADVWPAGVPDSCAPRATAAE